MCLCFIKNGSNEFEYMLVGNSPWGPLQHGLNRIYLKLEVRNFCFINCVRVLWSPELKNGFYKMYVSMYVT